MPRRELRIAFAMTVVSASIQAARADDAAATTPTPLPKVTVTAGANRRLPDERGRTATKQSAASQRARRCPHDGDLIRDQSMQSVADLARYVPGAGAAQGEGNRDTIILRGNSSTSDFFLDGVRDDVEYYRDFYNIDRVEILKGPNAMIFGRGGAGGIVNRVPRQANWQPVRELSLRGGSWDNRRATVDVGDAVNDRVALRITGLYENSDSYRDGFNFERMGVNPTAAFAVGEATVVRLSYEYYDYDRTADRGLPSELGRPYVTDPSTFFGNPDRSITYAPVNQGAVVIHHAFNDNVQLRNRTVYADYNKFYQNVYAGGPVDSATGLVPLAAYNNEQLRKNFFNQTDLTSRSRPGRSAMIPRGRRARRAGTDNFRNAVSSTTRTCSSRSRRRSDGVGAGHFPAVGNGCGQPRPRVDRRDLRRTSCSSRRSGWPCSACATTTST
jgi:catecholate siderophore receptor